MIIEKDLEKLLLQKGFIIEGGTLGCSYLNKYLNDDYYICISDMESSVNFVETDELLISLTVSESGEPVGVSLDSEYPLMQRVCSTLEEALNYVDELIKFFNDNLAAK